MNRHDKRIIEKAVSALLEIEDLVKDSCWCNLGDDNWLNSRLRTELCIALEAICTIRKIYERDEREKAERALKRKKNWYDISETGCLTEFRTKQEVIDHFNMMCESDRRQVFGCHAYRKNANSETLAAYEIHFSKGRCRLVKV